MEFKSLLVCWFFFYSSHNRRDSDDHHKFRLWQARWFAHTLGDGGWHSYFPSWLRNTPWKEKVFESVGGSGKWGESFWLLHARRPPTESSMDSRRRRCSSTLRGTEQNTQEWMRHQQGRRTTLLTLVKVFWFGVHLAAGTWWLAYNGNQSFRVLCLQTEGTVDWWVDKALAASSTTQQSLQSDSWTIKVVLQSRMNTNPQYTPDIPVTWEKLLKWSLDLDWFGQREKHDPGQKSLNLSIFIFFCKHNEAVPWMFHRIKIESFVDERAELKVVPNSKQILTFTLNGKQ